MFVFGWATTTKGTDGRTVTRVVHRPKKWTHLLALEREAEGKHHQLLRVQRLPLCMISWGML